MSALPEPKFTLDEYFALETQSERRHEYIGGDIVAMAGASRRHTRIVSNIHATLYNRIDPETCSVESTETLVRLSFTTLAYPDITIVCGGEELESVRGLEVLLNPNIVFEVLSPSTQDYDQDEKRKLYMAMSSVQDIVLVAQKTIFVEHYTRQQNRSWTVVQYNKLDDELSLAYVNAKLSLAEIYAVVRFDS